MVNLMEIKQIEKGELMTLMKEYFLEIDRSYINSSDELQYPYLDTYWKDANRKPHFIVFNNNKVGFALVNDWIVNKEYGANYSIAEFYVKPEYRRKKIGQKTVRALFKQFRGKWEIRQSASNLLGIEFWRTVINQLTNGNYKEEILSIDDEIVYIQNFEV